MSQRAGPDKVIPELVAGAFSMTSEEFMEEKDARHALARRVAVWILRDKYRLSWRAVAKALGWSGASAAVRAYYKVDAAADEKAVAEKTWELVKVDAPAI